MCVVVVAFLSGITAVTTFSASPSVPEPPGVPNQVSGVITPTTSEFPDDFSEVSEPQGHSESSDPPQVPVSTPVVTGPAGALAAGGVPVSTLVVTGPAGALPAGGVPVSTPIVAGPGGEPPVRDIPVSTQVSSQGGVGPHGELPVCGISVSTSVDSAPRGVADGGVPGSDSSGVRHATRNSGFLPGVGVSHPPLRQLSSPQGYVHYGVGR